MDQTKLMALAFSVKPGGCYSPSLLNMYKELTQDISGFPNAITWLFSQMGITGRITTC